VRPIEAVEGDVEVLDRREAGGGKRAGERVGAEVERSQHREAGQRLRRGAAERVSGEVERGEAVEGGDRGGDDAVETPVGEIQRDDPPEITGDARPGAPGGGGGAGTPPDEPGGLAVPTAGEVEERPQVGGWHAWDSRDRTTCSSTETSRKWNSHREPPISGEWRWDPGRRRLFSCRA
jgi:hypothetical protein